MAPTFLEAERLLGDGPRAFARSVERLLVYLGFDDIRNIDGPGDEGGDILAARGHSRWVFQCKWSSRGFIDDLAVRQVDAAKAFYGADRAVVATNVRPGRRAMHRRQQLLSVGVRIDFWDGPALSKFAHEVIPSHVPSRFDLYSYQRAAVEKIQASLEANGRAFLILATGLGKTVVAGEIVSRVLQKRPEQDILLVAHTKELVSQLERAMWRHLSKDIPTQILTGDERPPSLGGVVCATVASALRAVEDGWRPGFIVVDEAHHVAESGRFQELLDVVPDAWLLGVTATPWRGDKYQVSHRLGEPVFRMGIADGMAVGALAQVDYRLFVDAHADWKSITAASEKGLTIKDLNERLFLPQRDEEVIGTLRDTWARTPDPRAIIFCRTINHAEEFAHELRANGWRRAAALSTRQTRRDRNVLMSEFRDGRVPIVTAVDILNEGVDVPDINILGFMRVTHSRRIFVQQLGRGLRLRKGKDRVVVLDFVSDIRRIAATLNLQRDLRRLQDEEIERLILPKSTFTFSEPGVGSLLEEWIQDAASLEDVDEEVRLQFPPWWHH